MNQIWIILDEVFEAFQYFHVELSQLAIIFAAAFGVTFE